MKTRVLIAVVPVVVAGGIFLFLGSGAEPPNKNHDESGATDSTTAVAIAPTATDPAPAVPEPVSGIAPAPSKLSAGVDEIVRLAQSGVGDEVLQAYIENSTVAYQLSVDEILYLHDLGLSAQTIAAIVEHGQLLQHQPATAAANTPSSVTNIVAPSSGPAEPQPAGAPTTEGTSPVPPITDNTQAPANAYTITPPQQVNYNYFYQNLSPYGSWIEVPDCGWCWQPTVAVVDVNWRPYCNRGRWLWTDCGWYWQSDYSWGWAPFHYGRWYRSPAYGWVWAPGTTWGPAWVTWRYSDTYCGWAPLPPGAAFDVGVGFTFGGGHVNAGFDFGLVSDCYTFIPTRYFCDRTPWYYCLPRSQVVNVFNHTTIINNYIAGPNSRGIVHVGPGTNAIAMVARHEIRKVALRDTNPASGTLIKADRLERDGKTLAVFRPTLPQQAPSPPAEITRRQQESRKRSELLAKSEVVRLAVSGNERNAFIPASTEAAAPTRGTPLVGRSPTGHGPDRPVSTAENPPSVFTAPGRQTVSPSPATPLISRNPRSERRSADASSPIIAKPFQAEPAPRPLAELFPRASESRVPVREERPNVHQPAQNLQPELHSQPAYRPPGFPTERSQPAYRPPSNAQVITPPIYRQEDRKPEPPATRFAPPPVQNPPAPILVAPRAAEGGFNPPAYHPPQNSPPAAAPRAIEVPASRPSSPPPSYSPPPPPPRPQPAPSSPPPSQSRSDSGRKQR